MKINTNESQRKEAIEISFKFIYENVKTIGDLIKLNKEILENGNRK